MAMKLEFVRDKDTKNTVRFAEVVAEGDTAVVGMLYVQKLALNGNANVGKVTVTLDFGK